jgi:ankyrin repeat protein
VSCTSVLLEGRVNPKVRAEGVLGEPAIITAPRNDDAKMVDLLVKFGANVDLPPIEEKEQFTALTVAASYSYSDIEKRLLRYGADAGMQNRPGAKTRIYGQGSALGLQECGTYRLSETSN